MAGWRTRRLMENLLQRSCISHDCPKSITTAERSWIAKPLRYRSRRLEKMKRAKKAVLERHEKSGDCDPKKKPTSQGDIDLR
ncbi:hypothetical protein RJ639_027357 [Escallonia herrerae]|uniref:Uncharacterized protein n=1 Tax=Escallonia herrerae TaxID=1293975 RepID=A0AA88XAP6_9ASTE|nr:hypothetical protein RJ639_027357 [Escallonia herrerae]